MIYHIRLVPFRYEPPVLLDLNYAHVLGPCRVEMKAWCKVDLGTHRGVKTKEAAHVRLASCGRCRNAVAAEGDTLEFRRAVDGGASEDRSNCCTAALVPNETTLKCLGLDQADPSRHSLDKRERDRSNMSRPSCWKRAPVFQCRFPAKGK